MYGVDLGDLKSSIPHFVLPFKLFRPFCRRMGLQDRVLPFSLALFLTSSMTHADAAKVQVGFGRVNYLWPCFAGDTFRKTFTVESIRNTSDGNHSVRPPVPGVFDNFQNLLRIAF